MKKCFAYPDKKRYDTKKDADTQKLILDKEKLRVYHCDSCDGWHLTSKSNDI